MKRFALLVLLALCFAPDRAFSQGPAVVITDPNAKAFRVAVQRFPTRGGNVDPELFRKALVDALEFSSIFSAIDTKAFLAAVESEGVGERPPSCVDWAPIGADALVEGHFEAVEGGIVVEFRAVDITRCRSALRKRYRGRGIDARRIAREMADDIVGAFTGTRGVSNTEIAFLSSRKGELEVHVMEADGQGARAVTQDRAIKGFPDWSPSGDSLLYMSYQFRRSPHLFRIVRRGKLKPGRILRGLRDSASVYRGVHSPSGDALAVVVSTEGTPDIYVTNPEGDNPRRLTKHPGIDVSPTWSPDGSRIAFVSDRGGAPQVYMMNADGSGVRRLTRNGGYNTAPAWSPDGRWIVYESRVGGQFDLWLIDPEGRVNAPLVDHPRSDEAPSWSPDSRKIVFQSSRRGKVDVYVVDLDGKNPRRLTQGSGENKHPNWGPYIK